jgi:hypothetical protein
LRTLLEALQVPGKMQIPLKLQIPEAIARVKVYILQISLASKLLSSPERILPYLALHHQVLVKQELPAPNPVSGGQKVAPESCLSDLGRRHEP